jgi:hypothetical protein
MAKKSPSKAAKMAISRRKRLDPDNEKIILAKKKKGEILEYCIVFGIVVQDRNQIVMKATFDTKQTWRSKEKRYLQMLADNKKKVCEFLRSMMDSGEIESTITVDELLEKING